MAIDPALSHPERYKSDLALPNPPAGSWAAFPHPATIVLYKAGQGYPTFDAAKAKVYFQKVNDKVAKLIIDVVKRWDAGGERRVTSRRCSFGANPARCGTMSIAVRIPWDPDVACD